MKIICLVDNCALQHRKDLRQEHGLSIYIDTGKLRILFDAGISDAFSSNASALQVDLSRIDLAVLSHHHYDHGGGLPYFLKANLSAPVYLRQASPAQYSLRVLGVFRRKVGLEPGLVQRQADRFVPVGRFSEVAPGIFLVTRIGDRHPLPRGNRNLYNESLRPARRDDFRHELVLVIQQEAGLVVFTGCSHHGVLNILDAVREHFPLRPIQALIGGLHLINPSLIDSMAGSRAEVEELGRTILSYPVEKVYTGHCTGRRAYRILKRVMGDRLEYLAGGSRIDL